MNKNTSFALKVQTDLCTCCGLCADTCTYNAIEIDSYPEIDPYACRLCGSCVQACSFGALTLDMPIEQAAVSDTNGIWVLVEIENGEIAAVSKELLGKADELSAKLGQQVEAVLVGEHVAPLAVELIACGASRVHIAESDCLSSFVEENYAQVMVQLCKELHPQIILVGATSRGRGLSARIAALLKTGLTADCTELDINLESGLLHQIRPAFGGNLMATIVTPVCRPQMASVRPGVMKALACDRMREGEIIRHDFTMFKKDTRIRVLHEVIESSRGDHLENSRVIIGIGRGVKNKEMVARIRKWAESLGAVVAGSRAAVEAGLIDVQMQVGQTGHVIAPDLYIAIGISGQIQHTAAIASARKIIAINPDRMAPIFNVADYGFVGSIEETLPQLMSVKDV